MYMSFSPRGRRQTLCRLMSYLLHTHMRTQSNITSTTAATGVKTQYAHSGIEATEVIWPCKWLCVWGHGWTWRDMGGHKGTREHRYQLGRPCTQSHRDRSPIRLPFSTHAPATPLRSPPPPTFLYRLPILPLYLVQSALRCPSSSSASPPHPRLSRPRTCSRPHWCHY